jgi:diketogulonate reductase-like aldo/keto reductase
VLISLVDRYYANEKEVGEAVRQSGLKRSDIFITTKILSPGSGVDQNYQQMLDSIQKIDGKDGYVDLFLIHTSSMGAKKRKEIYQALEKLLEEGKTKSIGVSNWGIGHIEELQSFAKIYPPHVNQIEVRMQMLIGSLEANGYSYTHFHSNGRLLSFATRTESSSKHTAP